MALVAAFLKYTDDTDRLQEILPLHVEYQEALLEKGSVFQSGPFTDDTGSLIVFDVEDVRAAQSLVDDDPFSKNGVIVASDLHEWNLAMVREKD